MVTAYLHVTAFAFNAAIARLLMCPAWHVGCTRILNLRGFGVTRDKSCTHPSANFAAYFHITPSVQLLQPLQ
jgi:hypothetical protein